MCLPRMFTRDVLTIDPEQAVERITESIRHQVGRVFHRQGAVVGLSGGIDSAVTAFLCARALGPQRVLGLMMPDRATATESTGLAQHAAARAGIRSELASIGPILEAAGCYRIQCEAVRRVIPDYEEHWPMKVVLPSLLGPERLNIFQVVVRRPDGSEQRARLPQEPYL